MHVTRHGTRAAGGVSDPVPVFSLSSLLHSATVYTYIRAWQCRVDGPWPLQSMFREITKHLYDRISLDFNEEARVDNSLIHNLFIIILPMQMIVIRYTDIEVLLFQ